MVYQSYARILATSGLLACILSASASALATVVVPRTIEQMTQDSERVVRGRVVSRNAAWEQGQKRIYTVTDVQVLEQIQGPDAVPEHIYIRTIGGEVDGVGMRVSGTEKFEPGEEVLVFLRRDPSVSSQFQVVGMSQGKYTIQRTENQEPLAIPSVEGLAFARRDLSGVLKVDPKTPTSNQVTLNNLTSRIKAVAPAPASKN